MDGNPIFMEDHFQPGFKFKPLLLMGSQTHEIWSNSAELQAPEGFYLAGLNNKNVAVVRNIDPDYITYFQTLIEGGHIINISGVDGRKYLSQTILENPWVIEQIQHLTNHDFRILPFLITQLEQSVSKELNIPLYGSKKINDLYGTKSGIRTLAMSAGIPLTPGFICTSIAEVDTAINILSQNFSFIALKHDSSVSGFLSKKINVQSKDTTEKILTDLLKRKFKKNNDVIVVDGWLEHSISIGAHIEIEPNKAPVVCAAWQQIIDKDGLSYIGAGPLSISDHALLSLKKELNKLARVLSDKGAVGSFGPDFLITSKNEEQTEPDTAVLIELNTRIPYTAFPLEIVKNIKGTVGSGFLSTHISVGNYKSFAEIQELLARNNLLISEKNPHATGVIPYNVGMLPWNSFNIVGMADTWIETSKIVSSAKRLFGDIYHDH